MTARWGRQAVAAALIGLAALALAGGARAEVTPALRARLLQTPPGQPVPVIVTLARQVDPGRYAGRPGALIAAARSLADRTQQPVIAAAGVAVRRFWISNTLALSASAPVIERLAALRAVASVDIERTVRAGDEPGPVLAAPTAPSLLFATGQPGASIASLGAAGPLDAIGAPGVWSGFGVTGAGVRLGSIDTGVDPNNPDLVGKVVAWRDFVAGQPTPYDDNGHGTHTIGTMVGGSAQGVPVGVAPGAQVMVARAMGADGAGLGSNLLAAAQWMADPDGNPATNDFPAAVDNSWTANDANDTWFNQVVRTWIALGIVPVFAAGNSGPGASTIGSPGSYPSSLAVAAVDDARNVAGFSARGPVIWQDADRTGPAAGTSLTKPDLAAPGVGIVSTVGSGYLSYSGTSMAAPHVAGTVALLREARPGIGAAEIAQLLRGTAIDLGPPGQDPETGAGLLNALAAVSAALGRPAPAPAPSAALPAPPPAPTSAVRPTGPALRNVLLVQRTLRGRRSLIVRGRLVRPARLRAVLSPAGRAASIQGPGGLIGASRAAPAGAFELVLPLTRARPGRYRLVLGASDASGRALGAAVTRAVDVGRVAIASAVAAGAAPPPVAPTGARRALLGRLRALVSEYRTLAAARRSCPAANGAAALLRRAADGVPRASQRSLRARTQLVARALTARRAALGRCARLNAAPAPAVSVQAIEQPPAPPPELPPGTGSAGPALLPISLANIVHADALDLTAVLGEARLPATLQPLQLTALNDRVCRGVASICLGLDRAVLTSELQSLMSRNTLGLALENLGSLNLGGLLTQVDALLGGATAPALIAVERVDDRRLRLRPLGPLAELASVPDVPETTVGQIEVVGVIGCPPATVGGLPRACVS